VSSYKHKITGNFNIVAADDITRNLCIFLLYWLPVKIYTENSYKLQACPPATQNSATYWETQCYLFQNHCSWMYNQLCCSVSYYSYRKGTILFILFIVWEEMYNHSAVVLVYECVHCYPPNNISLQNLFT